MMLLSNKKFVLYLLSLSIILLGIYSYIVLNGKMLYANREYPIWLHIKNQVETKYNFICIGDSRTKAGFVPKKFDENDIKSINLSVSASTPIEGYYVLKNYLSNNHHLKYLLLSYSPFHLTEDEAYWRYTVKLDYLKSEEYQSISDTANSINDHQTLGDDHYLDYKLYTGKYLIDFSNGILKRRWQKNYQLLDDLEKTKGHFFYGKSAKKLGLNQEAQKEKFIYSPLIQYYLEELIKLAMSKKIKVYWYTMPFSKTSFTALDPTYKLAYDDYIHDLSKKYDLTVLNELYYLDDANFGDMSHVYSGAEKVTQDIKDKIF